MDMALLVHTARSQKENFQIQEVTLSPPKSDLISNQTCRFTQGWSFSAPLVNQSLEQKIPLNHNPLGPKYQDPVKLITVPSNCRLLVVTISFLHLKGKRKQYPSALVHAPNPTAARTRPGQSQELRTQAGSPICMVRSQPLESSSYAALQGMCQQEAET